MAENNEIVVVGDGLTAPLLAHFFKEHGQRARPLILRPPDTKEAPLGLRVPIYVGNGEYFANARKVFGEPLAQTLWDVSVANLRRARELGARWGVSPTPKRLVWYATSEREASLQRETVTLLPDRILRVPTDADGKACLSLLEEPTVLWSPLVARDGTEIECVERLEKQGLDTVLHYRGDGEAKSLRASIVVLASEEISPAAVPFLADKWISVTLSSFVFPAHRPLPFAASICNGGADFAVAHSDGWRVGSFRNLYQDKAVGRHLSADPATLAGVRKFFGDLGWIDPKEEPRELLSYEALGCDGLPSVGALPDLPGVYLLGGFGARGLNYVFELGHLLVRDIAKGGDFQSLRAFSTKRFL